MKKIVVLLIITKVLVEGMGVAQNLQTKYSETRCGLNFTQASVLLGKRMEPYGYPYFGINQPAPIIISGIPESANIEKAFLWWDIAGSDTIENVILQNPSQQTDTFEGIKIGGNSSMCWGPGRAFRADVSSIVSGNGTYFINGLPTDTTFDFINKNDVTGATLFVIYSDPSLDFLGHLIINDGYIKIILDTLFETMNFSPPADTSIGKAFMILSDMQGQTGNKIKMNNGPFTVPVQNYWDFEEKNTVYVSSINYSIFGVQAPSDCIELVVTGVYFQTPVMPISPEITRYGDILTSSPGSSYQWYMDNNQIPNATFSIYQASISGNYSVEVFDNYGCSFFSDPLAVVVCEEKIKPNINFSDPDSLWTDSINNNLQWFFNGSPIDGANSVYYIAKETGSYWVQAQNDEGCSVSSDIVTVSIIGEEENKIWNPEFIIVPNPNEGRFDLRITDNYEFTYIPFIPGCYKLTICNILGEIIFLQQLFSPSTHFSINLSKGLYFLKTSFHEKESVMKLIIE